VWPCIGGFHHAWVILGGYIPGICNKAAKALASYLIKKNNKSSFWLEKGLAFIIPIVIADVS
jgi:hypothetical protein